MSAMTELSGVHFILIGTAIFCGYFLPWLIAQMRDHPNRLAIFLVNLLLGWTFLGWVAALIWSVLAIPARPEKE